MEVESQAFRKVAVLSPVRNLQSDYSRKRKRREPRAVAAQFSEPNFRARLRVSTIIYRSDRRVCRPDCTWCRNRQANERKENRLCAVEIRTAPDFARSVGKYRPKPSRCDISRGAG